MPKNRPAGKPARWMKVTYGDNIFRRGAGLPLRQGGRPRIPWRLALVNANLPIGSCFCRQAWQAGYCAESLKVKRRMIRPVSVSTISISPSVLPGTVT